MPTHTRNKVADNDRRIRAAEYLQAQLAAGTKPQPNGKLVPLTAFDRGRINRELNTLALSIVSRGTAAAIRTKKTEALGWSDARRAWRRGRMTR